MANVTNVDALKELCAAIATKAGEEVSPADVKGETAADVILLIAKAYRGESILDDQLSPLTLSSEPGTEIGTTKITVAGSVGYGTYKYKTGADLPAYNSDLTSWDNWNGSDELTLEDSTTVAICEVNEQNQAVAGGTVFVSANL